MPRAERDSCDRKAAEARALLADPAAVTPMLDVEAGMTRTTPAALAARVEAKAIVFARAAAVLTAVRQNTEAAINAATTPAEVDAALAGAQAGIATITAGGGR